MLPSSFSRVSRSEKESLLKKLRDIKPSRNPMGRPREPEFRPQTNPRKSHRRAGSQISRDAVSPERARHLERNRLAANKCRLKKKREHEQIQGVLESETARRDLLLAEVEGLREELWSLKNRVFQHASCNDGRISLQLSKMNQNLLDSSSRRTSASSFSDSASSGASEEGSMYLDMFQSFPEWGAPSTMPLYDPGQGGGYFDELLDNFIDVTKM